MHTKQFNLPSFSTVDQHHSMVRQCPFKHCGDSCTTDTQRLYISETPTWTGPNESYSNNNSEDNVRYGRESSSTQTRKEDRERNRWMDDNTSTHSDEINSEREGHRTHHGFGTHTHCQCQTRKAYNPPNPKHRTHRIDRERPQEEQ